MTTLPFLFNGLWIDKHNSGGYTIHQNDYCFSLQQIDLSKPSNDVFMQKKFSTSREKIALASTCTRSDTSFDSAQLSEIISTSVQRKNVGIINKTIRKLNDLAHIVYHPLDLPSTYIVGYADAAFA